MDVVLLGMLSGKADLNSEGKIDASLLPEGTEVNQALYTTFDNTDSGLSATNVQDAIYELAQDNSDKLSKSAQTLKTDEMTQNVGLGSDGKLYTKPSSGGGGTSDHSQLSNRSSADQHPISAITGLSDIIPNQASSSNQLADKNFVNSSIGTNTAYYVSDDGQPFESVADLEAYTGTVTNNDYAFVTGTDSDGNTYFDRYKAAVSGSTVTWAKEYRLNNSSFTAEQWESISSGITGSLVTQITAYSTKNLIFVADDDTETTVKFVISEE